MWIELLCGFVIYRLFRRFMYDDDIFELETSDSDVKFMVADRIEKLYGGKVYLGLRIPDSETGSRQNIDMVHVTNGESAVIGVKNVSGIVDIDSDGNWVCTGKNKHRTEKLLDPVVETKRQAAILESYLEQRGIDLPVGYFSCKVVLPNPNCRTIPTMVFPPEVIPYDQWIQLKPEAKNVFSGWIKGAFRGGKKEMQDGIHERLNFILNTAPIWDRLELKENKNLLGEFLEFKGKPEDFQALRHIKRSKVSRVVIQKSTMFSFGHSKVQVLYSARDYRNEGASSAEWKEVTVRQGTELLFQPQNTNKVRKFKLSSIISMSLSA